MPGWWLSLKGGGGRLLSRSPRVKYLGFTSNGHLFLSTFCAGGGGMCDIWCIRGSPPSLIVLLNDFLLLWHDVARVVMTSREC